MAITITGTIEVQDNNGQNHIIDADDMGFDMVELGEGSMDDKNTHQGVCEEGNLTVTVDVEEYPKGAYNGHDIDVEGGKLVNDNLKFDNVE